MLNFDVPRYKKVVGDALNLIPSIEKSADEISKAGFSNIFFIGCGGTYAHSLPMKYWLDGSSDFESFSVIASEFMLMGHKRFTKDSLCIFSTRSGNTKEIIEALKFCKEKGARTIVYVSNDNTPATEYADYKFYSFAEDDHLGEAIYIWMIVFLARLLYRANQFPRYDIFVEQFRQITPALLVAKEQYEQKSHDFAVRHKTTDYHMVVGSGMLWGEAYDYAMCILEEMQWIKTKSIHAAEFFHGTLEIVESDTSMILLFGDDQTRPLMDRVYNFANQITKEICIFDTKEIALPLDDEFRMIVSPIIVYAILERLSSHLEKQRNHPLTTRRYYRKLEY